MKIIIITTKMPSLESGGPVRDYYLLKGLMKNKKNKVELFCITQKKEIKIFQKIKMEFNVSIHNYIFKKNNIIKRILDYLLYRIPEIEHLKRNKLQYQLLKDIEDGDIIQFNELDTYFSTFHIFNRIKGIKILNAHNVDYLKYKIDVENKSILHKLLVGLIINKFKKEEIEAIKKFDYLISCSEIDKKYFANYIPTKKIFIIPNGISTEYFKYNRVNKTGIVLFMGLLSYMPNLSGIKYYLSNIHTKVKKLNKDYKFYILGSNPPDWLRRISLNDKSIIVTGFVKDVRPYIKKSQICICPIQSGSGTRLKILEYMACGKPVISTTSGAEGIDINNNNIIITDNTEKFIHSINSLLSNVNKCNTIGLNARFLVEKKYNWNKINRKLNLIYNNIAK